MCNRLRYFHSFMYLIGKSLLKFTSASTILRNSLLLIKSYSEHKIDHVVGRTKIVHSLNNITLRGYEVVEAIPIIWDITEEGFI